MVIHAVIDDLIIGQSRHEGFPKGKVHYRNGVSDVESGLEGLQRVKEVLKVPFLKKILIKIEFFLGDQRDKI
jgi:hypothetical protein